MSDFNAKMHQMRFPPDPAGEFTGFLQRPQIPQLY